MEKDQEEQRENCITTLPLYRVWLCGPFCLQRLVGDTYVTLDTKEWGGHRSPRTIIKALLCAPGRRASRGTLLTQIWPEADGDLANRDLNAAASRARKLLSSVESQECLKTEQEASGFSLASQTMIWVDVDAALALLDEADRYEQRSVEAVALLKQALVYFRRGAFLEDEAGEWADSKRAIVDRRRYRSQRLLAEAYVSQGKPGQAETILNILLEEDPTDEDVVYQLMSLLHQHRLTHQALVLYNRTKKVFANEGLELSESTKSLAKRLHTKGRNASLEQTFTQAPLITFNVPGEAHAPGSNPQNPMTFRYSSREQSTSYSRREVLSSMLTTAWTTLTLSPCSFLYPENRERLLSSLHNPSYLDEAIIDDLTEIARRYWKLSANTSFQLLGGVSGLFQNIIHALSQSQTSTISLKLAALSSEVAQIIGKILFDLCDYALAISYYTFALKTALEIRNDDLWAAALGRTSLALLSQNQPQQAIDLLHTTQDTSLRNKKIRSWHTAIEAEIYSYLGEESSCLKSLERVKDTPEEVFLEADPYATSFTRSRLAGYEGACYIRLHQPQKALAVLEEAIILLDPTALRNLSRLSVYRGEAYFLLGDTQKAYQNASQALDLTQYTQSLDILRLIQQLSERLLITKGLTSEGQNFHISITELKNTITSPGEAHD